MTDFWISSPVPAEGEGVPVNRASCLMHRAQCTAGEMRVFAGEETYAERDKRPVRLLFACRSFVSRSFAVCWFASLLVCLNRRCVDETTKLSFQERVPMLVLLPCPVKCLSLPPLASPLLSSPFLSPALVPRPNRRPLCVAKAGPAFSVGPRMGYVPRAWPEAWICILQHSRLAGCNPASTHTSPG